MRKPVIKEATPVSITVAKDPVNGRDLTGTASFVKAGNRTRVTWPDARYVDYTYDALNRMKELRENGATVAPGLLATYSYDNLGRRAGLTRGNAVTTNWGYDGASRLASLTQNPAGTTYDQTYGYSYTPASGIASRSAMTIGRISRRMACARWPMMSRTGCSV